MGEAARIGERTHRYAEDVIEGRIVAGPGVRMACRRHFADLDRGDWTFDATRAGVAIGFFPRFLRHYKGQQWAGKPFHLEHFQEFIVGSLFGWMGDDGYRRFRTAYVETGKGNGKSPLAAGVGLILLVADGEPGAEVYPAATSRAQAGIIWGACKAMAEESPQLVKRLRILAHSMEHPASRSILHPVSSEAGNLHGPIPHGVLLDEIHAHRDAEVIDTLSAGTKQRVQPLIFEITNSGNYLSTVCRGHHEISLAVCDPNRVEQDDRWFGFVCGLDREDEKKHNWEDPAVWPKANPGLGTILPMSYLENELTKALHVPSKLVTFKRLNLCIWIDAANDRPWVPLEKWQDGARDISIESLVGRACYGGLDLSGTTDLTAFCLCFPPADGDDKYVLLSWLWVARNEAWATRYSKGIPYHHWVEEGHLIQCPGPRIKNALMKQEILRAKEMFDLKELAVDQWEANELIGELQEEGITAYPHGQGYRDMRNPVLQMEGLNIDGKLIHQGNPAFKWQMQNVQITYDQSNNPKINKKRSRDRVDGPVAAAMAVGRAVVEAETEETFDYGAA